MAVAVAQNQVPLNGRGSPQDPPSESSSLPRPILSPILASSLSSRSTTHTINGTTGGLDTNRTDSPVTPVSAVFLQEVDSWISGIHKRLKVLEEQHQKHREDAGVHLFGLPSLESAKVPYEAAKTMGEKAPPRT